MHAPASGERRIPILRRGVPVIHTGYTDTRAVAPVNRPHMRRFPFDGVSTRNILGKGEMRGKLRAAGAAYTDTVRAVVVRVSFNTDRDDELSSIYTGGDFDYTPDGASVIDPTPHDRSYFNSHMIGMNNYYRFQSCGAVEVVWDIFPEGEEESYKLSDIADYGPGKFGNWTTETLVSLFRDAVEEGDGDINFGDYDAIIVIHAGANLQSDIDFDTPNDIPSFFAQLGDEHRFTVDGGATIIAEGSVVPETAMQDGFIGGISAVLAHEFGHQLGLCDLYNTYTGGSAVGFWDLMDSGGQLGALLPDTEGVFHYAEGFIPSGLGAWCRTFLGWTDVDTVKTFKNRIDLPAVEKCPARVVRVEMGKDEYILVENRAVELDGIITGLVADENGVIIGTGNCLNCGAGIPPDPEWELVNGYDILLPVEGNEAYYDSGPGLVIWHVDEDLIAERWERNGVNASYPFGVSILEANGVVDLGDPSSPFRVGWWDDAYYAENNTTLSDSTLPASWSNQGVPSGVRVEGITSRDTLMSFGAGVRDLEAVKLVGPPGRPAAAGLLPLPGEYTMLLVDGQGMGWLAGTDVPLFSGIDGGGVVTPPALARGFGLEGGAVVLGTEDGYIHVFSTADWSEIPPWPAKIDSLVSHPVAGYLNGGALILAADTGGRLFIITEAGQNLPGYSPITLGPGDRFDGNLVVTTDSLGVMTGVFALASNRVSGAWLSRWDFAVVNGGSPYVTMSLSGGYPYHVNATGVELAGEIVLAGGDVQPFKDGDEVFIIFKETGRIVLCGSDGVLSERNREDRVTADPALYDLNGDGMLDIVYSDGFHVYAVSPSGANLTGWPRRLDEYYPPLSGFTVSSPIVIVDTPEGGRVIAGTSRGIVHVLDGRGETVPGFPRKVSGSLRSSFDLLAGQSGWTLAFLDDEQGYGGLAGLIDPLDHGYVRWRTTHLAAGRGEHSWVSAFGNLSRTAYVRPATGGSTGAPKWTDLAGNLRVYPNPSYGGRVNIHFVAPESGEAKIEILTLTGELVVEKRKRLSGGNDEFLVSMSGRASGIYICRIIVTAKGRSVAAFKKFAVVN